MSDQGGGPFPGWYDDPEAPGRQRYWDGRAWTEHVTGPDAGAAPDAGGPAADPAPDAGSAGSGPAPDAGSAGSGTAPDAGSAGSGPAPDAAGPASAAVPLSPATGSAPVPPVPPAPPTPAAGTPSAGGPAPAASTPAASPYARQPASATVSDKSFVATWLLAWLLGVLGIDRFYLGKVGTGILKLITAGGLGIWWLVDLILVLAGAQRDRQGRRLEGYEEHKRVAWIVTVVVIAIGAVIGPMTPWWMPFGR